MQPDRPLVEPGDTKLESERERDDEQEKSLGNARGSDPYGGGWRRLVDRKSVV